MRSSRTYRVDELGGLRACLIGLIAAMVVAAFRSGLILTILVSVVAALLHDWFMERLILRGDEIVRYGAFRRRRIALSRLRSVDVTGRLEEDHSELGQGATLRLIARIQGGEKATLAMAGSILPYDLLRDLKEHGVSLGHSARVLLAEPHFRGAHRSPENARKINLTGIVAVSAMLGGIAGSIPF